MRRRLAVIGGTVVVLLGASASAASAGSPPLGFFKVNDNFCGAGVEIGSHYNASVNPSVANQNYRDFCGGPPTLVIAGPLS